ncbi:MAG: tRNA epoxyqueuosine(34) reductase QueG [Candidatus Kerfeldbacteria bacterium]|nr:tRNA epoxyqueuosine(34) reductase QueG [Candidatus Kerfeldbacteria bacterium]
MTLTLAQQIVSIAQQQFGFTGVAIIPAEPTITFSAYQHWIEHDYQGSMAWMHTQGRDYKRADVRHILPSAKTIITLTYSYYTQDLPPAILNDPARGIFARYAWGRDYHKVLEKKLQGLITAITTTVGHAIVAKAYVDTGPVLERALAQRAGLGFIGKNSLLINSAIGSYLFLAEIMMDEPCELWQPRSLKDGCRRCTRCLDSCPTKAIVAPYTIDARKCISYLTIEHHGAIPEAIRPLMKNRIYGCDICQEVCPWNSTSGSKRPNVDWPESLRNQQAPYLVELAQLTEATFQQRFAGTPIRRVKRSGLLRNVAVALGNWGSVEAAAALTVLAHDADALVREHAIWGLKNCQVHSS